MQKKNKGFLKTPASLQVSGFNNEEIRKIRKAFALFEDEHTGKVDITAFKSQMENLKYDQNNPILYQLINNIEEEKGELDFESFMQELSAQLGNKTNEESEESDLESRERINKLFELWSNNEDYLDKEKLGRLADEFDIPINDRELNELVERAASNNQEITKDDFYNIMIKKPM